MAFIKCRKCNHPIPSTAKTCSVCGRPNTKPFPVFWTAVSVLTIALAYVVSQGSF